MASVQDLIAAAEYKAKNSAAGTVAGAMESAIKGGMAGMAAAPAFALEVLQLQEAQEMIRRQREEDAAARAQVAKMQDDEVKRRMAIASGKKAPMPQVKLEEAVTQNEKGLWKRSFKEVSTEGDMTGKLDDLRAKLLLKGYHLNPDFSLSEAPGGAPAKKTAQDMEQSRKSLESQMANAELITQNLKEAKKLASWSSTGNVGKVLSAVSGETDAAELESTLESLKSQIAQSALERMRLHSRTGGAVGQVSEQEWAYLASSVKSLNPKNKAFLDKNLGKMLDIYERWLTNTRKEIASGDVYYSDPISAQSGLPAMAPIYPPNPYGGTPKQPGSGGYTEGSWRSM